jgi:hypothetical protein
MALLGYWWTWLSSSCITCGTCTATLSLQLLSASLLQSKCKLAAAKQFRDCNRDYMIEQALGRQRSASQHVRRTSR